MIEYTSLMLLAVVVIVIPAYRTYQLRVEASVKDKKHRYGGSYYTHLHSPKVRAKYNRRTNYK